MTVTCSLCPRHCALSEGQTGFCRARGCREGQIVPLGYGQLTALALDPIEKKPLARFHPGSKILSLGGFGCNLRCPFCQNAEISMAGAESPAAAYSPEALVAEALRLKARGNIGLAFTYNEPLIQYEFVRDCAALARKASLVTVLVTNGTVCREPLLELLPLINAMNIDLKGFHQDFYDWVGGDLETVKETIALASRACHVEVTTLVIPGRNDDPAQMDAQAAWLAGLSPDLPLHVSRFFPRYHCMDLPATPVETIFRLADVARRHLRFVYTGNC